MNKILKGITYSYYRNIGWQDKAFRAIVGLASITGVIYFFNANFTATILLGVLAAAQVLTVSLSKCIICYFAGVCTITKTERLRLDSKGIPFEK